MTLTVTASADQVAQLPDGRIVIAKPPDMEICGSCNGHDIARSGDVGSSCYYCDGGANDIPPADLVAVTEPCQSCDFGTGYNLGVKRPCPRCHAGRPLFDLKVECGNPDCDEGLMSESWLDRHEPFGDGWQGATPACPHCDDGFVAHAGLYVPGPLLPMLDGGVKTGDYPPDGFYLTRGEGWWLDSDFEPVYDIPAAAPGWYAVIAERRKA